MKITVEPRDVPPASSETVSMMIGGSFVDCRFHMISSESKFLSLVIEC